jgi:hypothetical protein
MKQQEMVYRHIACAYIDGVRKLTQLGTAEALELPLSTVNGAVRNLEAINAIRIGKRSFEVLDLGRLLLYWATKRKPDSDIAYQTRVDEPVKDIEGSMPDDIAFTCYSAYRLLFKDAPADYSEVYVYATDQSLGEIMRRFRGREGPPNITVFRADRVLETEIASKRLRHSSVCTAQLFVDLWNVKVWYAKDFTDALARRLGI